MYVLTYHWTERDALPPGAVTTLAVSTKAKLLKVHAAGDVEGELTWVKRGDGFVSCFLRAIDSDSDDEERYEPAEADDWFDRLYFKITPVSLLG